MEYVVVKSAALNYYAMKMGICLMFAHRVKLLLTGPFTNPPDDGLRDQAET
ncbi:hypothetical protein [Desulfosporosinus youngiae]|uniref:hypothetical protein n=1 Tax=Desulfosporosinus youngiae TaxID=339862 RepID=UPI00145D484D|nr:hypothetical protein [Desulfosporosinus youngiae]